MKMLGRLESAIDDAGGVRALARRWGVSAGYVSQVRLGRRQPGPRILLRLGLRCERTVRVRYVAAR